LSRPFRRPSYAAPVSVSVGV